MDEANAEPIQFPAGLLKKVAKHAAKENMRYALNGVLVESDSEPGSPANRFHLVATDGRQMAIVTVAAATIVPKVRVIIPTDALGRMLASDVVTIGTDGVTVKPKDALGVAACLTVPYKEGTFPNWADVVPKDLATEPRCTFNAEYVHRACALFMDIMGTSWRNNPCAEFRFGPKNGPSIITLTQPRELPLDGKRNIDIVSIRVVIMPMTVGD